MDEAAAIREANKALVRERHSKFVNFLLIPIRMARALGGVATEWAKGVK